MGIVSWIILGLIAGAIAKILLPGRDPGGFVVTTLIGIAGSFVGGWLSSTFLHHSVAKHFWDPATWGSAIVGAFVLLVLYRIFFGNSRN
ncbi:transglycosylase [Kitasatospora sp. MMS16-BH015]|uniref:GlsB/YeaQ/YmgE family stress response membrane protein n=1 Tax=Kitasatospora sp. MMS16-BH015 TaxID=2018025 RepID=UPI000CA33EB5|nr:GlsB/YeaQ/YmgE family stress response membrane protein [Kitasatospora sp. MMS16-BH015]AUG80821.1 transglycosylase [Kitasatospora sp. MMS16-BH015]